MGFSKKVVITEVCPRDGWQNFKQFIPTKTKKYLIKKMLEYGAKSIEITSFINPQKVPQMADAERVVKEVKDYFTEFNAEMIAVALNKEGVDRARACGVKWVKIAISVSEEHNRRNTNMTIADSLVDFKRLAEYADDMDFILAFPCVFGSPFGEEIDLEQVLMLYEEGKRVGVKTFGLSDTAGISNPKHTREVLKYFKKYMDIDEIAVHLHDTRNMGLANAFVAIEEGVYKLDSSLGAMGGCPFIPNAKGNIATEDLVKMVLDMDMETTYDLNKVEKAADVMAGVISGEVAMTRLNISGD